MPESAELKSSDFSHRKAPVSKPSKNGSGVMDSIIAQGQENVARLEETFSGPTIELATDYLRPNSANPRSRITQTSVEEMANAIQQVGEILQPLLVRHVLTDEDGTRYEVVCGNRRLMAARFLGLPKVPVRVRDIGDEQAARFALWENLSREDLDAMDLAESINGLRLVDRVSWDEIGQRFGFSRQWAWKQQKIVELPDEVKDLVREGKLSPSKAMLLSQMTTKADDAIAMARRAVAARLSHRDLSALLMAERKHVLTSSRRDDIDSQSRKHVLTFVPPVGLSRRSYSKLNRAAEDLVTAINEGQLNTEYAASLRGVAERILSLAEPAPSQNLSGSTMQRHSPVQIEVGNSPAE